MVQFTIKLMLLIFKVKVYISIIKAKFLSNPQTKQFIKIYIKLKMTNKTFIFNLIFFLEVFLFLMSDFKTNYLFLNIFFFMDFVNLKLIWYQKTCLNTKILYRTCTQTNISYIQCVCVCVCVSGWYLYTYKFFFFFFFFFISN